MRFGDRRTSDNVESQRGQSFGGRGGGGLGGAGASMLFGLVASRFGIGGVIVLALLFFAFGGGLGDLLGGGGQRALAPQEARPGAQPAGNVCQSDEVTRFSCQVLASTEEQWGAMFAANGSRYTPPRMVFYDRRGSSGCGAADSAMGPFYCPADQRIYLDTQFFRELAQRFRAPGDFAQAYVIAHEVGHHIQTITGVTDQVRRAQQAVGQTQGNALQVRMELQADCYAGVWASRERGIMDEGDLEEGMGAAAAIGDDTLQRAAQGTVVPESFTHGTSAQRQEALMRGFRGGGPAACDAYMQGV
ncbi:MAG: neutral zinc metallopeptidase [Sphingomonas sp.]|nr:neutral zinc metallopeptidase [Sphingomonas sp.]